MATATGREAEREGWWCELRRYVYAVAWIQAQYLHPGHEANIAADFSVVDVVPQDRRRFMNEQLLQAQTRHIGVAVPVGKIAEWKRSASLPKGVGQKCFVVGTQGESRCPVHQSRLLGWHERYAR